jgi:hypothetical protein
VAQRESHLLAVPHRQIANGQRRQIAGPPTPTSPSAYLESLPRAHGSRRSRDDLVFAGGVACRPPTHDHIAAVSNP